MRSNTFYLIIGRIFIDCSPTLYWPMGSWSCTAALHFGDANSFLDLGHAFTRERPIEFVFEPDEYRSAFPGASYLKWGGSR